MKFRSFSAVFPAYNEEENLKKLIADADQILRQIFQDYEIIVVNDGSVDSTQSVLENLSQSYPALKIVRHPKNLGYGKALSDGLAAAKNELVFFSDADNQFDIKEINLLLADIDNFDAVFGYRKKRNDNLVRTMYASGWNIINRLLFKVKAKDINCAFKVFNKKLLDKIECQNLQSHGAAINAEMLIKFNKAGAKIKEVPVSHFPRIKGKQTGGSLKIIFKALKEIKTLRAIYKQ